MPQPDERTLKQVAVGNRAYCATGGFALQEFDGKSTAGSTKSHSRLAGVPSCVFVDRTCDKLGASRFSSQRFQW